jgi:Glyoxalase/Bleomycin resistance protein/Dioxygenase superfamily
VAVTIVPRRSAASRPTVPDRCRQRSGFQLVLWPGTPGQAQPVQGGIPAAYTIETGDCRAAYEELKSRGVEFETGVLEYPWGYVAVFQEPDGNRLQLREGR